MPRLSKIGAAALAAFGWTGLSTVSASYLVVAGGGGAGGVASDASGGGGAGGLLAGTTSLNPALSYTVIVGAGGAGGAAGGANDGSQGSSSSFNSISTTGGGFGGGCAGGGSTTRSGGAGGSGGGSTSYTAGTGGTGVSGQGNNGGTSYGGGGGQSSAGSATAFNGANNGGNGYTSSISGSSVNYAGGGCSGGSQGNSYGGGNGEYPVGSANNTAGTANRGGGGGGAWVSGNRAGGAGGSGVVIISYLGAQQFGGGVVISSGGYTIHTFNTSGTLSPISSLSADYLIVAGGGGGAALGGGGGAGGLLSGSSVTIDTNSNYLVTVGAGGIYGVYGGQANTQGGNSTFSMVTTTAVGGGFGGGASNTGAGGNGGSGGGGSFSYAVGTGTSGQGYAGGAGSPSSAYGMGGGGGSGSVGVAGTTTSGGNGGSGTTSSISGTSTTYAGGGGGGIYYGYTAGTGSAGGGNGGANGAAGSDATANTGSGGGGGGSNGSNLANGGNGGSGIVIIRYAGSTQLMAGGSVTITGGYVIHTFTSSGYLSPLTNFNNSLRFRASANAYLSRTVTTSGNSYKFTQSLWFKRGSLGSYQCIGYGLTAAGGVYSAILRFSTTDTLDWYAYYNGSSWTGQLSTSQVFRDPAAWYHIVISADTTQATSSDRLKMYINGVQVTAFSTASYPSQNTVLAYNITGQNNYLINSQNTTYPFDGYYAEMNYIDGQQLTPNAFGSFNSYGVWTPVKYGGSYGTNGFYLPFNPGTANYAGSFNGSSQQLSVASNAVFNFSGDFTAECWYYATTVTNATQPTLFTIGNDTGGLICAFYSGNFYCYMLTTGGVFSSVTPPLNAWTHVAWVRSSGINTLYINGVPKATYSASGAISSTGGVTVGKTGSTGTALNYFQGSVSNFRIVNSAVYTSTFTPSSTTLTAISGTQLLTLQNSTIIDNSTNAFSITNTGTVTMSAQTPFIANAFRDQGPAGNNWTANNIGQLYGTTYDSMTDVPTLTSSTAANYAVLNPLMPSSASPGTYSNGNLQVTAAVSTQQYGYCTFQVNGKFYFEVIASNVLADTSNYIGAYSVASGGYTRYYSTSGQIYNGSTWGAYGSTWNNGETIGVAIDTTAGSITFYNNNTSQGAITGLATGAVNILSSSYISGGNAYMYFNFGQQPFKYTPPTGYVALNTYNM